MHLAAQEGNLAELEKESDDRLLHVRDNYGQTPLHLACFSGRTECLRYLLKRGGNVNATTFKTLLTPLHTAASEGHWQCVEILLKEGASCNAKDIRKEIPLHKASFNGSLKCIEMLLDATGNQNVNAEEYRLYTPLHLAVESGDLECMKLLLSRGANVHSQTFEKWTPLHVAAVTGDSLAAELLLDNGALVDARDSMGQTPLYWSLYHRDSIKIIQIFIDRGADCFVKNGKQMTPHDYAYYCGNLTGIKIISRNIILKHLIVLFAAANKIHPNLYDPYVWRFISKFILPPKSWF
jgi:ankyrin repeat protein